MFGGVREPCLVGLGVREQVVFKTILGGYTRICGRGGGGGGE